MTHYTFSAPALGELLDLADDANLDKLEFGVVKMDLTGKVLLYNQAESTITGVTPDQATGKHFFTQIAPCTNNFMVALRYDEVPLDEELDYMFTYVTTPIRVRLRLLRASGSAHQYILVKKV